RMRFDNLSTFTTLEANQRQSLMLNNGFVVVPRMAGVRYAPTEDKIISGPTPFLPCHFCRRKSKLYDQSVCPSHQALPCCTWVWRGRRPAIARTAGRPPSYDQLGEDGPERARDTHTRVCRMVTGRVRRRPCQARHGCLSLYR